MTTNSIQISGLQIDTIISSQAHANVYRVTHLLKAEPHALKIAKTDLGAKQLLKETALLRQFTGTDGIALYIASGMCAGMPYLLMPLYQQSLHQVLLNRREAMSLEDAMGVLSQLANAITKVHGQGVMHCDLHPQNIMQDARKRWCLIDFGGAVYLAKENYQSLDKQRVGSPLFASPEQQAGIAQLSVATDIYALSAIFCALLSGKDYLGLFTLANSPAQIRSMTFDQQLAATEAGQKARQHWLSLPALNHSDALKVILSKGLAPKPANRYSSVAAFFDALVIASAAATDTNINININVDGASTADITQVFTHSAQLSDDIKQLKQAIVDVLTRDGKVSSEVVSSLVDEYQLAAKISQPDQVIAGLVGEAELFLKHDNNHTAFLEWSQNLHAYKASYGNKLSRENADKFVQQGIKRTAGSQQDLQRWLARHFVIEWWCLANKGKSLGLGLLGIASVLWLVWLAKYLLLPDISTQTQKPITAQVDSIISAEPLLETPTRSRSFVGDIKERERSAVLNQTLSAVNMHSSIEYALIDPIANAVYTLNFKQVNSASDKQDGMSLPPLFVMTEEVSQGLWLACVNAGKCRQAVVLSTSAARKRLADLNHPVVNVSWYDVTEDFIPFLNDALNAEFALPTMAQWLTFAFNSDGTPLIASDIHCKDCEYINNIFENTTMPINRLSAGPYGLYHVYGNAQEWLQDCWQDVKLGQQRCDQAPAVGGAWLDTRQGIERQPLARLLKTARSITTGFRLVKREKAD